MQDAWRSYLALAIGLTEAPRRKAQETARRLVGAGAATAVQLQTLAEELVTTGAANRGALTKLVRFEAERALGAVGLATADEVTELTRRVRELERQLRETPNGPSAVSGVSSPAADVDADHPIAPGSAAEPTVPPMTAAPTTAKDPSSGSTATMPNPPKNAVATKAVAKKTVAKKTVAKRAAVKKTVGKAAVPGQSVAVRPSMEMSPAPGSAKSAPRKQQPGGSE